MGRRAITQADLVADLRRVATTVAVVTHPVYQAHGRFSAQSCVRHFGSWRAALAAAGLLAQTSQPGGTVEEAAIVADLRRVYRQHGRICQRDYRQLGAYAVNTVTARWGRWRQVCAVAGLPYQHAKSKGPGVVPEIDQTPTTVRRCLMCQRQFRSTDVTHRVCLPCKHTADWKQGM
jgi:hypothetical protein